MSEDSAFELQPDGTHLGDDEFDATLVKFDGSDMTAGLISSRPLEIPEKVFFEANLDTLKTIDYPINDVSWPIMSRRMLDALLSVGHFTHRAIPVIMLDDTVKTGDRLDAAGNPRVGVAGVKDFLAVQVTQHTDAFDWERSEYVPHPTLKNRVFKAKKLVLRGMPLPPLFRLSAMPGPLLVSAAGRAALVGAQMRELRFISLDLVS
jgi:hypothetical protein